MEQLSLDLPQQEENRLKNVIALCGRKRRGKDWYTKWLVENKGAIRLSFSDEVRRLSDQIFPWLKSFDIDDSVKDLPFRHDLNPNNLTPREIWKQVGTVRNVQPDYFVAKFVENQHQQALDNPDKLFIITDLRTPDEVQRYVNKYGIPTLKIISPEVDNRLDNDPFEDYIAEVYQPNDVYVNRMIGIDDFEQFFDEFMKTNGVVY